MTRTDPLARIVDALDRPWKESSDFDLNPSVTLPEGRKLRPAAVLIPILEQEGTHRVILTKRSSALKHHPGQVAFPGGKVDGVDADARAAALREAYEEIGLDPSNVDVLGELPSHETVTSFRMTPVLGRVRDDFVPTLEPGEVAEVFTVPLDHVLRPANFVVESRRWRGQRRYYYAVPYGPYYIWGATARVLRGLADHVS